jgi:multidrug efflux pump subunit AcrA (membrane-fusion protein)
VTSVSPIADNVTHTAAVEAVVRNSRSDLVPGGFVRVTLHARASRVPGGVNVPSAAIVGSGDDAAIWTDSGGNAHRVPVRVLGDDGTTATVAGNLPRGNRVVLEGAATLEEGQPITAVRS